MDVKMELLSIGPLLRPNGEMAYVATFVQPFVPIADATQKKPAEARIVVAQDGPPKFVNLPFENKITFYFSEQEFKEVSEKFVVGKEYTLKLQKGKIELEL